jgi:hypothetical protein
MKSDTGVVGASWSEAGLTHEVCFLRAASVLEVTIWEGFNTVFVPTDEVGCNTELSKECSTESEGSDAVFLSASWLLYFEMASNLFISVFM